MKRIISLLLCMMLVVSMVGCQKNADTENPGNSQNTEAEGPIDMDSFLKTLVKNHPGASVEELCKAMLENAYFKLFSLESTEYYYPGLDYEYVPKDIEEAYCIMDVVIGTGSLVYAIVPKAGADAKALGKELEGKLMKNWMVWDEDESKMPDQIYSEVLDGKLFVAMYRSDMMPITGTIADKAQDFVDMFHDYVKKNSVTSSIEIADYLMAHQKFTQMYTLELSNDQEYMEGFEAPVTGFADGAVLSAMMRPNPFIAYVFCMSNEPNLDKFENKLRQNANPAWNVCMIASNIIIEKEGDYVLFMMCND